MARIEHHDQLTREEMSVVVQYGTRIAPIVLSVCNPELPKMTNAIAGEVVRALINTFLNEQGDSALIFVKSLSEEQKLRLHEVFRMGGVKEDVQFLSPHEEIEVSDLGI